MMEKSYANQEGIGSISRVGPALFRLLEVVPHGTVPGCPPIYSTRHSASNLLK